MNKQFMLERIASLQLRIVAFEDAIIAVTSGGVQTYNLDTGQTKQVVTQFDVARLQATLDGLINQLAVYNQRLNGCGTIIAGAAW